LERDFVDAVAGVGEEGGGLCIHQRCLSAQAGTFSPCKTALFS
jgi:hypothetical protein